MRKVCYISGTRADFGLMKASLLALHHSGAIALSIVVTGMHLAPAYGNTVDEITAAGLPVTARVPVDMEPPTGATMARNIGRMLSAFVDQFELIAPDCVLLLGDRGEMLAGALAAIHLNIPVVHIHGGERSGTVDEPVRHAISKLAHYHFAASPDAAQRLIRMGEQPAHVFVTGAPGLDGLADLASIGRATLCAQAGLTPDRPLALMVFHPVLQESAAAREQTACILARLRARGVQVVALMPNADAGSAAVREVLQSHAQCEGVYLATHFPREHFVSWMAAADFMIGNSSAGIIEAATFGTPVINVGSRQGLRERNANIVDVAAEAGALDGAIHAVLAQGRLDKQNIYGDGKSAARMLSLLSDMQLDSGLLMKSNAN